MYNDNKNGGNCQTPPVEFSVYVLWCRTTGMYYVGVTGRKVEKRIQEHIYGKGQFVDKEIARIGWEGNWDWWVVEKHVPSDLISDREKYWVAYFNSVHPNGYNLTTGGMNYFKHSKKVLEKISKSLRGKKGYWKGKNAPICLGKIILFTIAIFLKKPARK